MNAACVTVGARSRQLALEEEQVEAYVEGAAIRDDGRVEIGVSYDAQWNSPKKAHNAMECKGAAVGQVTKKVVSSGYLTKDCSRCKRAPGGNCGGHPVRRRPGEPRGDSDNEEDEDEEDEPRGLEDEPPPCNRTFTGPSGNMEPLIASTIVHELNTSRTLVAVQRLCTDLDTQLAKRVREDCEAAGEEPPEVELDPNHCVKALKGKLLPDVKQAVNQRGAFTQSMALRFGAVSAAALHQHRANGDLAKLKGALENVIDHSFNRHDNCLQFFQCPVAKGERTTSSYPGGKWLDVLSGPAIEAELREQFRKRLTSPEQLRRLMGQMQTQVNESLHTMQISKDPKKNNHGGSNTGHARQHLTHATWNDGLVASSRAVEGELNLPHGQFTARGLGEFDGARLYSRTRSQQPKVKAMRQAARKRRKLLNAPKGQRRDGYRACSGWDDSDDDEDGGVGEEELAGAEYPPYSELVGSDVCVLAAAYPDAAERLGADRVGWRGVVSAKRGGGLRAAQVTVFGSWFYLSDATWLQPILQEGEKGDGSSDDSDGV